MQVGRVIALKAEICNFYLLHVHKYISDDWLSTLEIAKAPFRASRWLSCDENVLNVGIWWRIREANNPHSMESTIYRYHLKLCHSALFFAYCLFCLDTLFTKRNGKVKLCFARLFISVYKQLIRWNCEDFARISMGFLEHLFSQRCLFIKCKCFLRGKPPVAFYALCLIALRKLNTVALFQIQIE